jgi:protein-disulfide isomerase
MKKIVSILFIILVGFTTILFAEEIKKYKLMEEIKIISEGDENAKIKIITYESLTCGHCANFHKDVYPELKKDFIDKGLVKIEFRHFPLDIAAFNASKISQCRNDGDSEILHYLYANQKKWMGGARTPVDIDKNLGKYVKESMTFYNINMEECLNNKNLEDHVLNDRIEGVKKFKVNATPTIIINDKKFDKALNYKNLKKYLEKLI